MVGHSLTAEGETHAFLWTPDNGMVDLGTLGGAYSFATDVNDQGNIIGSAENEGGLRNGVIWVMGGEASPNQAPVIETIVSPVAIAGELFELTPVVSDAEGDPYTLSWTGDIPETAVTNGVFSWTPAAADVGSYSITVTAVQDDDATLTDSETFALSVTAPNRAPIADAGGPYVAAVGQPLSLDGTGSSDPDGDLLTYSWTLSDGSTATGATGTLTAPLVPGLYGLTLLVSDPDGASSSASVEVAVYDPAASAVTGGGWFHSPAGALASRPEAEGRARFALHVGYRKGRSTPDGNARLSFEAGELHLNSGAFDWLVVGGEMARVRGSGILEGRVEPVQFEVVLRAPDRIRVRIWDGSAAIYDSQEVTLGGGRIRIQQ